MVKPGWEHPKDSSGHYIPLHDGPFSTRAIDWDEERRQWDNGFTSDYGGGWEPRSDDQTGSYEDYAGERPKPEEYMPEWPDDERTHLVMYESCTEGTPISPGFLTPEELARWLADNGASAFGDMTATYEQWLATCKSGFAPSAVMVSGKMMSGVEALSKP